MIKQYDEMVSLLARHSLYSHDRIWLIFEKKNIFVITLSMPSIGNIFLRKVSNCQYESKKVS